MLILPSGPSTSMDELDCVRIVRDLCFVACGSGTLNVTSGGIDRGILPILELHGDEVENLDDLSLAANAGTRKSGKVRAPEGFSLSVRRQRRFADEYIVLCSGVKI